MSFWNNSVWEEADKADQKGDFTPVPDGTYTVVITNAETKETKSGGHMLKIQLEIIGPNAKGRVLFDNINVDNSNITAVQIGLGTIKQMSTALGIDAWYEQLKVCPTWQAAEQHLNTLHNASVGKQINARVITEVDKSGKYDPQNKIKRYSISEAITTAVNSTPAAGKKPF